ncbi:hypothetical protein VTK73DRAFT_10399 [Phialemonium thermophilum]|uniref:Multicopper oxidase n=1 Tax=Phialemonium thermophilum TaxID=223376 RepID=A0ABR3XGY9_9PEZI
MDEEVEGLIPQKPTGSFVRRSVDLFFAILAISAITLFSLALGLVIGLNVSWVRPSLGLNRAATVHQNTSLGAPPQLVDDAFVPIDRLVNATELDLRTGFNISTASTTREYTFHLGQAYAAPDGFRKPMILINGQSPGPLIEANVGDTIRVHVINQMANASTSIHWHGIDQKNTTWMDGVTGVSQCAIPPGSNFTYEFRIIDQRGTFWYHAHTSIQYSDGMFGPIIIHDPDEMIPEYDDEKIVFLGDVYHTDGTSLLQSYLQPGSKWSPEEAGVEPLPDNFLMNGQHEFNCSIRSSTWPSPFTRESRPWSRPNCTGGRLYTTSVKPGHVVRLRLINHSSYMSFWFSIDNHTLTIVEIDGVEVEPITDRGVYVNVGQRYSVLVRADGPPGRYQMRATLPQTCFVPYCPYTSTGLESIGYQARGILSYLDEDGAGQHNGTQAGHSTPSPPLLGVAGNTSNPYGVSTNHLRGKVWEGCDDMPFDMPVPKRKRPAVEVDEDNCHSVAFQFQQVGEINRIFINRTSWAAYQEDAQIWQAMEQSFTPGNGGSYNNWGFRLDQQVLLIPKAGRGAQIAINSRDIMEHPFHFHGNYLALVSSLALCV